MQFSILAALAGATLSIAAPASYSVEIDILDSPITTTVQHALTAHNPPKALDNGDTLPFSFRLQDAKTGSYLSAPALAPYAPVTLGDPVVFNLQGGVLTTRDADEDGQNYQVGVSPLLVWPPRSALLPYPQQGPGQSLQILAVGGDEGLVIQFGGNSQRYGGFTADGGAGAPVVLLPPNQNSLTLQVQQV